MTSIVHCQVNGSKIALDVSDEPLLFVLRNRLDLKATHFGCGLEQCGACVVSVNNDACYSCTLPVSTLEGATVTTAEALAGDPVGATLLDAFEAERAGQCGYCLPGILMSAFVLLKIETSPTRERIIETLDRHLCRCGAHGGILRAVERAAAVLAERTR